MDKAVIVALDVENKEKAMELLKGLPKGIFVKVGMELYYKEGQALILELKALGYGVFLDLKLHDIPNTVYKASKQLAELGVDIFNVHVAGGKEMMEAAKKGIIEGAKGKALPMIIGVTQLTSTSQSVLEKELLIEKPLEEVVLNYAELAKSSGLDGVVCSVWEVKKIKETLGQNFKCVTPGIRLEGDSKGDQVRVATPQVAKKEGSDFIVVGRSITGSDQPNQAYEHVTALFI